jgi:hypothetical protein
VSPHRTGCHCVIARLEAERANGAEFLLIPTGPVSAARDASPLAGHLVGHYEVSATAVTTLLYDLRSRRETTHGWPRLAAAAVTQMAALLGDDIAVLDWTEQGICAHLAQHNVFVPPPGSTLPYLDGTVPIVVIDQRQRLDEARRVASAAVLEVTVDLQPVLIDAWTTSDELRAGRCGWPAVDVVVTGAVHDALRSERLRESLCGFNISTTSATAAPAVAGDVVVIVEPGIVPLPGAIDAAITLLRRGATAVAPLVLDADGKLAGAGVTVFGDGTWSGVAHDSGDLGAPWYQYVRECCGATGMIVVDRAAFDDIRPTLSSRSTVLDIAGALWSCGYRVAYQPETAVVQTDPSGAPRTGPAPQAWDRILPLRPDRPRSSLDEHFWRTLVATDDVSTCNLARLAGVAGR